MFRPSCPCWDFKVPTAVEMFAHWAGTGAAFEWTNADGKVDWDEADRRLKDPTFYYGQ